MVAIAKRSTSATWPVVMPVVAAGGALLGLVLVWVSDPGLTCKPAPTMCLAAGGGFGQVGYTYSALAMAIATCALFMAALRARFGGKSTLNWLAVTVAFVVGVAALAFEFALFRAVL